MTDTDVRDNSVAPDGFHLEPTYEHLVAETGYDPELGAAEVYADFALVQPIVSE